MCTLEFVGIVKSESAQSVHLFLDAEEIDLQRNGDTWTGKKSIDVNDNVAVKFTATGLNGTKWALELDITCPNGPVKILSRAGIIGTSGRDGFERTVAIGADPCK